MDRIVVGSRSGASGDGITLLDFDGESGSLSYHNALGGIEMPTYQVWDRKRRILYSVSEDQKGAVLGWHLDEAGAFNARFKASSLGSGPCHLALSPDGLYLGVSNYSDGVFTLLSTEERGTLNYSEQYEDSSINFDRQEASHVHCSLFFDGSSSMVVTDLGGDAIHIYRNEMRLSDVISTPIGSGPRHLAISSDGRYLFVSAELSGEVLVYQMGKSPTLIQQISTLPLGFDGENTTSAIVLCRDGRHLYVANRGHDSIVHFSVKDGWLSRIGWAFTERTPWDFALSSDQKHVIVANTTSSSVTVYPRDVASGVIGALLSRASVNFPSCITVL